MSIDFCFNMFVRIVFVSVTGTFEYRFVMSKGAKVKCGISGVSFRFWIRSVMLLTLKALGSGVI